MCGICGVFHYREPRPVAGSLLRRMCRSMVHRGPDDEGMHREPGIGLGMRRLAIIDPAAGQQPLFSQDGTLTLVCNGEIYNHQAWRSRLAARGHRFAGGSDCEVILHLYREYGINCLDRLQGMFAFALWDRRRRRLLLARDRLGIKPLYYADTGASLVFGSELKVVLQAPFVERRVDPAALHHYLSLNYVPAPWTLVAGVRQLNPGEYLVCSAEGEPERQSYWDLRFCADESRGEAEWVELVRQRLHNCVSSHLMSDVAFGAFLSGGIDSSAVVALMSQELGRGWPTFSIDFAEPSYSEANFARDVAQQFGTAHHELTVSSGGLELLDRLIWYADDPLADSSMLPVYLLAQFARKRVKMVLTGDGGDEVFAGYPTYNADRVRRLYRMVPRWARQQLIRRAVEALPVSLTKVSFDFKAKRFVAGAELDAEEAHFWWRVILSESAKRELYSAEFSDAVIAAAPSPTADLFRQQFCASGTRDRLSRMLYVDTRLYLPADMLVKVDRMTMANSLEARVPFLDHELVELAATVPSRHKLKRMVLKSLLKRAFRGVLPDSVLDRKKAGFNVPINRWFAAPALPVTAAVHLDRSRLQRAGYFRPEVVERMIEQHRTRRADHSFALWGILCLQLWHERFIGSDTVEPPHDLPSSPTGVGEAGGTSKSAHCIA